MPSKNRVAGYPPNHIYQKLKDFAKEHNLSESKALIMVLAEYFGVASNVAQEVSYKYASIDQVQELEKKFLELSELYSSLKSELDKTSQVPRKRVVSSSNKTSSESVGELLPHQLDISRVDLPSNSFSDSEKLKPMTRVDLAERFGINEKSLGNRKIKHRDNPQEFLDWSKDKDKDGIAWDPYREDKLYHPVQNTSVEAGEGETDKVSG